MKGQDGQSNSRGLNIVFFFQIHVTSFTVMLTHYVREMLETLTCLDFEVE